MLEEGRYPSIRERAAAEGTDRAHVGRLLNLTRLAPDVIEAILDRRQPEGMMLPKLRHAFSAESVRTARLMEDPYPHRPLRWTVIRTPRHHQGL